MKHSLILILSLCTLATTASAQNGSRDYGRDYNRDRNMDRRDDKYIDSDALENQAIQGMENTLRLLKNEIITNNNYGYGTGNGYPNGSRGGRNGANTVDLLSMATTMEIATSNLKLDVRGARSSVNEPRIQNELRTLSYTAQQMVNSIPALTRSTVGLIDNIFAVTKAVGGIELAINAPRSAGPIIGIDPDPATMYGKAGYCSLSFQEYTYGTTYSVSGEGMDTSQAAANLYSNCSNVSTSNSTVQACKSRLAQAVCINTVELARASDATLSRFAACTLSFQQYTYGTTYTVNGAATNMVAALANLWDSCKNVSTDSSTVQSCRANFVAKKFSCVIR